MYKGHTDECSVFLEVVSDYDINVLHRSPVFTRLDEGHAPASTT
jgi:hypothetical protein